MEDIGSISILRENEYYGPLLYSYIETILQSGELLEDDFQAILTVYRTDSFCINKKQYLPYSLITSSCLIIPSIVAAKNLGSFMYVLPSAIFTFSSALYSYFDYKRRRSHDILLENLIHILKRTQELNKTIYKYLLERKHNTNKLLQEFFHPFSKVVKDFVRNVSNKQFHLHQTLISNIFNISQFCRPLMEDFEVLKEYQPSVLSDLLQGEYENYVRFTKDIISVQQLLNSKLLSYIAIIFCCEDSRIDKFSLDSYLDKKLPLLVKLLNDYHKDVLQMFQSLKRVAIRGFENKMEKGKVNNERISGKFRDALDTSVNNVIFILEKMCNIIDAIETDHHAVDEIKINQGLIDLRSQTAATYEALDVLCKLYGILSESKITCNSGLKNPPGENNETEINEKPDCELPTRTKLFEDKEKYELYVDATEEIEDTSPIYEEPSNAYLRLVIKELKQNLSEHEFYVSARERWKDESDEERNSAELKKNNVLDLQRSDVCISDDDLSNSDDSSCEMSESEVTVRERLTSTANTSIEMDDNTSEEIDRCISKEITSNINDTGKDCVNSQNEDRSNASSSNKTFSKIETSTRTVQNEEQENWNPILASVKAFTQNVHASEVIFGEDVDSD